MAPTPGTPPGPNERTAPPSPPRSTWTRTRTAAVLAAVAVALTLGVASWTLRRVPAPPDGPLTELDISPPAGTSFGPIGQGPPTVVSPDGSQVVLVARAKDGVPMLWVRPLATNTPRVLAGTEDASRPFWSPDGRSLGFAAGGKLKRVGLDDSPPQVIADTTLGQGTSNAAGVTLFTAAAKTVQRVSPAAVPAPVFDIDTKSGEIFQSDPVFLPDGEHFLYITNGDVTGVVFASLDATTRRFLFDVSNSPVHYVPNPAVGTGWLIYSSRGRLVARPFEPSTGELSGEPVAIVDAPAGAAWSVSNNGILTFRRSRPSQRQLSWFDRNGKRLGIAGEAGSLGRPRISPDQKTVSLARTSDGTADIWLLDLTRNAFTRFTSEPGPDNNPVWSSDGQHLYSFSEREHDGFIVERPANGVGAERIVATAEPKAVPVPSAASSDGKWLIVNESGGGQKHVALVSLVDGTSIPVPEAGFASDGSLSPNGRWLLYTLNESGRDEVFVRTVPPQLGGPATAEKWPLSSSGGRQARWRADGTEIFYLSPEGALVAVPVEAGQGPFQAGVPRSLFRTGEASTFDVTADGQRFLVNQPIVDSSDTPVTVIVNWPRLLQK